MPDALRFNDSTIKGVALERLQILPHDLQFHDRKFWGVQGLSRVYGNYGSRKITVPVLIYDAAIFTTANILSTYIHTTLNTTLAGTNGDLEIYSLEDHDKLHDCSFEGAAVVEGPKKDHGNALGGGYFAFVLLDFTQLGTKGPPPEDD